LDDGGLRFGVYSLRYTVFENRKPYTANRTPASPSKSKLNKNQRFLRSFLEIQEGLL